MYFNRVMLMATSVLKCIVGLIVKNRVQAHTQRPHCFRSFLSHVPTFMLHCPVVGGLFAQFSEFLFVLRT